MIEALVPVAGSLHLVPTVAEGNLPDTLDLLACLEDLPVWGVKDSGGETGYAEEVHAAGKGVLVGTEDDLPGRLRTAHGSISALADIVPEQVVALHRHVREGRSAEAPALSAHLQQVRATTRQDDAPGGARAGRRAAARAPDGHRATAVDPRPGIVRRRRSGRARRGRTDRMRRPGCGCW